MIDAGGCKLGGQIPYEGIMKELCRVLSIRLPGSVVGALTKAHIET